MRSGGIGRLRSACYCFLLKKSVCDRLITLYQTLYDNIHAKSGQGSTLKLQYIRTEKESVLGWVRRLLCGLQGGCADHCYPDHTAIRSLSGAISAPAQERNSKRSELGRTMGTEGGEAIIP